MRTPKVLTALTGAVLAGCIAAGTVSAQAPDAAKWADVQAKAKQEGEVVVTGPASAALRSAVTAAFKERYGVEVNYLGINPGEVITRLANESKAGKVSIDINIGGTSSCWLIAGHNQIESMNGKIIDPALFEPGVWHAGQPKLSVPSPDAGLPADFRCTFQTAEWVMTDLFVNAAVVKPTAITSWKDLLKPEYKGKIAAFDPRRPGPGQTTIGYLGALFGADFVKELLIGQQVRLTADNRQLAEWVVRGEFPIGLALVQFAVETYRKQGLPLERVFPADGMGPLAAGFSNVMLIKNGPHPNAAQLFANWFGSKEAQTLYENTMMETSLRADITGTAVPDYVRKKPGVAYPVVVDEVDHYYKVRLPVIDMLQKELQR